MDMSPESQAQNLPNITWVQIVSGYQTWIGPTEEKGKEEASSTFVLTSNNKYMYI
jgi:hypothetical protein